MPRNDQPAACGRRLSQCDRILVVLADGRPHRMEDIHRQVGFCRLNSRVAELRARGHQIICDKTGGHYTYQLVSPLRTPADPHGLLAATGVETAGVLSGDTTTADSSLLPPGDSAAAQLTLGFAA